MGRLYAFFAKLHSTMGGSSDTELKLLAVIPTGSPLAVRVVMMVTPVANIDKALRKSRGSRAGLLAAGLLAEVVMDLGRGSASKVGGQGQPKLNGQF